MNKIFVYGIFTSEVTRERVFSEDIKTYPTNLKGYELGYYYDYSNMRNVTPNKDKEIDSIIMEVNDQQLADCDRIEGISCGMYRRITVNTSNGNAYMYLK